MVNKDVYIPPLLTNVSALPEEGKMYSPVGKFAKQAKYFIRFKCYDGKHLVSEFSSKGWNVGLIYQLLQKLWVTGWFYHCFGSSR